MELTKKDCETYSCWTKMKQSAENGKNDIAEQQRSNYWVNSTVSVNHLEMTTEFRKENQSSLELGFHWVIEIIVWE